MTGLNGKVAIVTGGGSGLVKRSRKRLRARVSRSFFRTSTFRAPRGSLGKSEV